MRKRDQYGYIISTYVVFDTCTIFLGHQPYHSPERCNKDPKFVLGLET